MKRFILLTICSILIFCNNVVFACSCILPEIPEIAYARADAVFTGVVENIKYEKVKYMQKAMVLFRIQKGFKGNVGEKIMIDAGISGGMCGYPFKINNEYLVYATIKDGQYSTGLCTRTRPMSYASEDMALLENLRTEKAPVKKDIRKYYNGTNGKLLAQEQYLDGVQHGKTLGYYNGTLIQEVDYENGMIVCRKIYSRNGILELDFNYKEGLASAYYENGQIKSKGGLANNKLEGLETSYFENGNIETERTYKDGELIEFKEYDEGGNIVQHEKY